MRIAVDVMGGDHGCGVVIAGAKLALEANKKISALYLVGDQAAIHAALPPRGFRDHRVKVIHTSEVVTMEDKPVVALRKKKDSSIARAAELVRDGEADALVSLGNTGGIFAAATFKVGRIAGVDRGCIATVIPRQGNEFVLLDAGANVECKPLHLAQFAVMGNVYSREVLSRKNPRVGILSIGTEDSKGNELTLEAFKLCKKLDLNFIGNVEGHDLFKDHVDVVVCDGFVGNIVLKTSESLAIAMFSMLKRELMSNAKAADRRVSGEGCVSRDPQAHGSGSLWRRAAARLQRHGFQGARLGARTRHRQRAARDGGGVAASGQQNHRPRNRARE